VSYRPNVQLSKASAFRTLCHTVWMLIKPKHHLFGRLGSPSRPSSVSRSFELLQIASVRTFQQPVQTTLSVRPKLQIFFSKIKYRKIAATVRTTWIPVGTRYSLWQVCNSNSTIRTPAYHGPDARMTDMEITCSRSPVWTAILLVRTREAFIRKLLAADVQPSGQ
jgi:hypothetical protein